MNAKHWMQLSDAFHEWPFKPDVREDETYVQLDSKEITPFTTALSREALASLDTETVDNDEDDVDELISEEVPEFQEGQDEQELEEAK